MPNESCDIGLIGLAVMGQNLVLNMNDHGYRVAVFNRTVSKVDDFVQHEAAGTQVVGTHSIPELIQVLKKPRRVMLMVKAGDTILFGKYSGQEIKLDGVDYIIMREDEILAVIDGAVAKKAKR